MQEASVSLILSFFSHFNTSNIKYLQTFADIFAEEFLQLKTKHNKFG